MARNNRGREFREGDVCCPGPIEHSLCGNAPEAYETGDSDWPILFASEDEQITCPLCLHTIDFVRNNVRWDLYRPKN